MATMTPQKPKSVSKDGGRGIGKWIALAVFAVVLTLAIPIALLIGGRDNGTSPPTTVDTTPPTTAPVTRPAQYTLYFLADHIQDSNRPGPHLMPVRRSVDITTDSTSIDEVRSAILALVGGVAAEDSPWAPALSTSIPVGSELLGLTVDQTTDTGIVTLDFNEQFASGAGTFSVAARLAQVVYTATAFEGIDEVVFSIDGDEVEVFSSEGLVLDGPQTRADYEDFLPLVMIVSPLPGESLVSPVTVTGLANAFEATVSLRLETLEGDLIAEDFTTATCGSGCFGEFAADIFFEVAVPTPARMVALEYSAEDGSPMNVFAVPVTLEPGGVLPPPVGRSYDIDVDAMEASLLTGQVIVSAAYGNAVDEVGLDPKGFGPCCFAVSGEGEIVLLDAQNTRLVKYTSAGVATVLYDFDPADFVPDAIAVIRDTVIVVGMTNRPLRPYDAIALSLSDGELRKRVETRADINGDLRATTDGVYWARSASNPQWLEIADADGSLMEGPQQRTFAQLPGESTLTIAYDAGIEVSVLPAGDSRRSTYDVMAESVMFADVLGYQRYADGALVLIGNWGAEADVLDVTVLELGTGADDQLVANAYAVQVRRTTGVGSFNTFRYGYGGLYALSTNADGIEILRFDF